MNFPSFFPRLFHPAVYQGKRNPKNYFEGWYYKHVDASGEHIWSIIFGVSWSNDSHSFIQIIEGKTGKTDYIRFPLEAFSFHKKYLEVSIGNNKITEQSIDLDLKGEVFSMSGSIQYLETSKFPQKVMAPGIMGWYTYAPFMECYHGVVSMNHMLSGSLTINKKEIDFSGGKGYIEKDWGRSMPSDWIWMQCNHFDEDPDASMMISVARIPWLTGHFPGFLSFIRIAGGVHQFATYNGSKITSLDIREKVVDIILKNRKSSLNISIERNISGLLKAPVQGEMNRKIAESLDARMKVELMDSSGKIIFSGTGSHAGLEIVGNVQQYIH